MNNEFVIWLRPSSARGRGEGRGQVAPGLFGNRSEAPRQRPELGELGHLSAGLPTLAWPGIQSSDGSLVNETRTYARLTGPSCVEPNLQVEKGRCWYYCNASVPDLTVFGPELPPGYSCGLNRGRELLETQEILCTCPFGQRVVPTWCKGSQRSHSSPSQGKPGTWRRGPAYSKWLDVEVGARGEFLGIRISNSEYNSQTSSQSVDLRPTVEKRWRARCGESRTAGSVSSMGKRRSWLRNRAPC